MIDLGDRLLFENGMSIIDEYKAVEVLIQTGALPSHLKVMPSGSASLYEEKYGECISFDDEEEQKIYPVVEPVTIEEVLDILLSKSRYSYDLSYVERMELELNFFNDNNHLHLLVTIDDLINRFKHDGVVWGGRGSSCASYILYLLEVHDVDPVLYDINFREFSKVEL